MAHEIRIPSCGASVSTVEIIAWHVQEGDAVEAGTVLLTLQADKSTLDIESAQSGVVRALYYPVGAAVPTNAVVGYIGATDEAVPSSAPPPASKETTAPGVEIAESLQPLTPMRRIIAERMCESTQTMPHFFVTYAVDVTDLLEFRKTARREKGLKASVNDYIIKAVALTLREFPRVNDTFVGEGYRENAQVNIGFAVALDEGLVVPVVRDADVLSLEEIAERTKELVGRARDNRLSPVDYSGGTFTISNMGMLGVDNFCAIIHPGQGAILAVGTTVETPVVVRGEIVVRTIMKMTLSSDHRLIDGALSAQFLKAVKEKLETVSVWESLV